MPSLRHRMKANNLAVGLLVAFVLGFVALNAMGQLGVNLTEPNIAAAIDKIFAGYDKTTTPGCALGVWKDGKIIYTRGYGMANLEYNVPITADTVFEAGSVSKQFTAGAIQILCREGKLALGDDIRKYVPEVPPFGPVITIRHLLTHTSGIRDQWGLLSAAGRPTGRAVHTLDEILDLVNRQKDLNFAPGDEYLYSNTGYALMAWVVLRASGTSLADFCEEKIFRPLGMADTQWRDDFTEIVKGRATAYSSGRDAKFHQDMSFTNVYGNGGLLTTMGDLLTWSENFWNPRVIGREALDEMEVPAKLNDGTAIAYALGLGVSEYKGLREISHSGATAGYRAFLARYPEQRTAIAVLSNSGGVNAGDLARKVADVVLAGVLKEKPKLQILKVAPEELQARAGLYHDLKTDAVLRLSIREGKLVEGEGRGRELIPVGPGRFAIESGAEYVFEAGGDKKPATLRMTSVGFPSSVYTRVEPALPTPKKLAEYEGRYWSDELEVFYIAAVKAGKLFLQHRPEPATMLEPTYEDGFLAMGSSGGAMIRFSRDKIGRVDGMSVYSGRVRHLRFSKK